MTIDSLRPRPGKLEREGRELVREGRELVREGREKEMSKMGSWFSSS